jgi:RNA polymerase sigma factor (TIGR02999 family)
MGVSGSGSVTSRPHTPQPSSRSASNELTDTLYGELRRMARGYMRAERPGHQLQATALVHEAYVRLGSAWRAAHRDRTHIRAIAARAMRRVLIDVARARHYQKRGGHAPHVSLDAALVAPCDRAGHLAALDDVLEQLARVDPRKRAVIELRFFVGLTIEETAAHLGVSPDTVQRDWRLARSWLRQAMAGSTNAPHHP